MDLKYTCGGVLSFYPPLPAPVSKDAITADFAYFFLYELLPLLPLQLGLTGS